MDREELIVKYLNNELNPADRSIFESTMAEDELLSKEIKATQVLREMLIQEQLAAYKDQMKQDLSEMNKIAKHNPYKSLIIAIIILVLTAVLIWGFFHFFTDEEEVIAIPSQTYSATVVKMKPIVESAVQEVSSRKPKSPKQVSVNKAISTTNIQSLETVLPKDEKTPTIIDKASKEHAIYFEDKQENQKIEATNEVCADLRTQISLKVSPSTYKKANGMLVAQLRSDETSIPQFYKTNAQSEWHLIDDPIEQLLPGNYPVYVQLSDEQSCFIDSISVPVSYCLNDYKKHWERIYEDSWSLPLIELEAKVSILSSNGNQLRQLDYNGSGTLNWDGKDDQNNSAPSGYYVLIIKYNNDQICKAHLTILN